MLTRFIGVVGFATAIVLAGGARVAQAAVSVSVPDANTAVADIALTDAHANTFSATVTIRFDHAVDLSPDSIGISADLFDPATPPGVLPFNVAVDAAFPLVITVEPPTILFANGYDPGQTGDGNLAFFDTYEIEVHTTNLVCGSASSSYRLLKAPHGSNVFADVTDALYQGSVRARGRGGSFSRFIVASDTRNASTLAVQKLADLTARLGVAAITDPLLLTQLTTLLGNVSFDLLTLNIGGALGQLQVFINDVTAAAGISIANEWKSDRSLVNDAGELLSLAQTLQFTLRLLQGGSPLCVPPPT